jgi:hypothetical protein
VIAGQGLCASRLRRNLKSASCFLSLRNCVSCDSKAEENDA